MTRLRYLGDALLSLPLVAALRRVFPRSELHYLAEPATLEMLRGQPEIDRLWTAQRGAASLRLLHDLRAQRFAVAIDLFCNPRSALLVGLCGAPLRIGEDRRGRRHAYTWARHLPAGRSALEQHLDAMRGLGVDPPAAERPVLHLRNDEQAAGEAVWREHAPAPGVLLHLDASQPAKEWPLAHAVAFVQRLAREGLPVLLSSAPLHRDASAAVAARTRGAARLLPVLPLRQVLGLTAAACGVVSVDGALAHAGPALGRPTVALFGPTVPSIWFPYERFGPYRVLHAGADCGACDRVHCPEQRCMAALDPELVWQTLRALLAAPAQLPEAGHA